MDINDLRSFLTVLMFFLFIGIIGWTFSSKRKQDFEEAAKMVSDDDDVVCPPGSADPKHN